MIEFAFCMIILILLIYATVMIFRWSGLDLAFRRSAHDHVLTNTINPNWGTFTDGPAKQIDPFFYKSIPMNSVWGGSI